MGQIKAIFGDNRGVSPVIGVILMVAITVILAAVIGAFVLNLGGDLQQTPQAQIGAEDASGDVASVDTTGWDNVLSINHNGGDEIASDDYEVLVQFPGTSGYNTLLDSGGISNQTDTSGTNDVNVGLNNGNDPGALSVGDTIYIQAQAASNSEDMSGEWGVRIIHTPSDSILIDQTVSVN